MTAAQRSAAGRLSPSEIFRATPADPATVADSFVVRRDRAHLRALALRYLLPLAALCFVPAVFVWLRREPDYFTTGVFYLALIVALLVLGLGVLGVHLWSITGPRRRDFDAPVLAMTPDQLQFRPGADLEPIAVPWARITSTDLVGRSAPLLKIRLRDPEPDVPDEDAEEPEEYPVAELDFESNPPPPFVLPDAATFALIRPTDEVSPEDERPPVEPEGPDTGVDQPPAAPARRWEQALHRTPYTVRLAYCNATPDEVLSALSDYRRR